MDARERPARSLPSRTERIRTELGNLYLTVTFDEDERPFELFGWIGKTGTFRARHDGAGVSSAVASPAPWNADRRDNRAVPRHQGHGAHAERPGRRDGRVEHRRR